LRLSERVTLRRQTATISGRHRYMAANSSSTSSRGRNKQENAMQPNRQNPTLWYAWYPVIVGNRAFPIRWLTEVWSWRSSFTGKWLYGAI
jgi:hypothetical protein